LDLHLSSTEQSRWLETPLYTYYLVVTTESPAIHGGRRSELFSSLLFSAINIVNISTIPLIPYYEPLTHLTLATQNLFECVCVAIRIDQRTGRSVSLSSTKLKEISDKVFLGYLHRARPSPKNRAELIEDYLQILGIKDSLTRVIPSLESEVKKLEVEISDISKKIQLVGEYIDYAKRLEVAIAYREMRRLEDELKKLEDAQRVWNSEGREIESLIREIKGFKDQLQNIRQSIEDSLNKISKAFNMNVDSIDKVSNIKNSKREEMDRLIKELKGLESRKSLYRVYIERFEVSKACSLCGASIKDPDEFKKYIADGISKIDVEIKRISTRSISSV
jgi:predicted  nucleic acid-binding Zn-ribbon protein